MDPISSALGAGYTLLQALWNVKEACSQKRDNDEVAKELSTFILHLDQDLLSLKAKMTARSNSSIWAAGTAPNSCDYRIACYMCGE